MKTVTTAFILRKELQRRLTHQGLSAADLVRQTGIAKQVISDWLAGAMPRNISQVKTVADALGVTIDELCFGVGTDPGPGEPGFARGPWISGVFEGRVRRVSLGSDGNAGGPDGADGLDGADGAGGDESNGRGGASDTSRGD